MGRLLMLAPVPCRTVPPQGNDGAMPEPSGIHRASLAWQRGLRTFHWTASSCCIITVELHSSLNLANIRGFTVISRELVLDLNLLQYRMLVILELILQSRPELRRAMYPPVGSPQP